MTENTAHGSSLRDLERARLVQEFLPLNRRRSEGNPPLSIAELARCSELRTLLERSFGVVPPPDTSVRRRSLRIPVRLPVRFSAGIAAARGTAADLSEGGIFVVGPSLVRPRTPLELEIEAQPTGPPLRASGAVVWTRRPPEPGPTGMGIRFENLSGEQERAIGRLVENALARL